MDQLFSFVLVTFRWLVFQNCQEIYLSHPVVLSSCWRLIKQTLKLLVVLQLAFLLSINNYCLQEHVIPWAGRESYWSNFYLAGSEVCQSPCHSGDVCYVKAFEHVYVVTMFILHRRRYT